MYMELHKVEKLAKELMRLHGCSYGFQFNNRQRQVGCCNYRTETISLSKSFCELNSEREVRDTILHEIAHTFTRGHGHGKVWKAKAIEIGCTGDIYCSNDVISKYKYRGVCPCCSKEIKRYRRDKLACGHCCKRYNNGKYTEEFLIEWNAIE